jgi:hypothetical protein
VCVNTRADYVISDDQITFRLSGSFGLQPGDQIAVTTWNDTSEQNIVQLVWDGPISEGGTDFETFDEFPFSFGSTTGGAGSYDYSEGIILSYNDFNLNQGNQNPARMIVSYNGRRLFNGLDYVITTTEFVSFLTLNFTISPTDVVVAILFTDFTVPEAMAFRIFQDMRGLQATYRILPSTTTVLHEYLAYDDDIVYVENASACGEPALTQNAWGVVTINGERIMYRYRDVDNNTLSGLLRGTAGTAAANHYVGDKVIAMGRESILEQGYEDEFVYTNIMANGTQTVFTAPNVDLLIIDSTEYTEALRVLVGGIPVPETQYVLTSPNPATVTFYDPPAKGVQVTIGIVQGLSWYAPGVDTASNGAPLQVQLTPAAKFLQGQV